MKKIILALCLLVFVESVMSCEKGGCFRSLREKYQERKRNRNRQSGGSNNQNTQPLLSNAAKRKAKNIIKNVEERVEDKIENKPNRPLVHALQVVSGHHGGASHGATHHTDNNAHPIQNAIHKRIENKRRPILTAIENRVAHRNDHPLRNAFLNEITSKRPVLKAIRNDVVHKKEPGLLTLLAHGNTETERERSIKHRPHPVEHRLATTIGTRHATAKRANVKKPQNRRHLKGHTTKKVPKSGAPKKPIGKIANLPLVQDIAQNIASRGHGEPSLVQQRVHSAGSLANTLSNLLPNKNHDNSGVHVPAASSGSSHPHRERGSLIGRIFGNFGISGNQNQNQATRAATTESQQQELKKGRKSLLGRVFGVSEKSTD